MMYPNLKAEMARKEITSGMIAKTLGYSPSTITAKLNKPNRIKLSECRDIILNFFPGAAIDYLFANEELQYSNSVDGSKRDQAS